MTLLTDSTKIFTAEQREEMDKQTSKLDAAILGYQLAAAKRAKECLPYALRAVIE